MIKLLLIDALNLIRRIYAAQERPYHPISGELSDSTKKQLIHNTVVSIESSINKLVKTHQPTHAIAVFDSENRHTWRHDIYPDYKAGRKPMPSLLSESLGTIQDAILKQGVDSLLPKQHEADDVIISLANKIQEKQQQAIIVSTDKGYLPFISQHIQLYDCFKKSFSTLEYIDDKYGVEQSKLVSYWALVGDSTNNIKGVSGIGPKTAQELLANANSLKEVLNKKDVTKRVKDALIKQQDDFKLACQLVKLRTDLELGINLKDVRIKTIHDNN